MELNTCHKMSNEPQTIRNLSNESQDIILDMIVMSFKRESVKKLHSAKFLSVKKINNKIL